jgi:hypothetical protein
LKTDEPSFVTVLLKKRNADWLANFIRKFSKKVSAIIAFYDFLETLLSGGTQILF